MPTRSSVKTLPPDLKATLDRLIAGDRTTQIDILKLVNAELDSRGADPVSRSALSRYATAMDKAGKRIRESRAVASQWIGQLGEEPSGDVGRLLIEIVRTMAFETTASYTDDDDDTPAAPKELQALAKCIRDLEHAATVSVERELKIRQSVAAEAASAAEKIARSEGLTADTIDAIKRQILGVGARPTGA